jgi:hypothetical protein
MYTTSLPLWEQWCKELFGSRNLIWTARRGNIKSQCKSDNSRCSLREGTTWNSGQGWQIASEIAILGAAGEKEQTLYYGQASPSSHHSSHSSRLSPSTKSWEKPGWKGTTHGTWRNIQRYIWDDPDKAAIEKKSLKLDFFLLSYTCLGLSVARIG